MMRNGRNVTRSPPTYSIKKTLQFRSGMNVLGKALRPGVCVCYWWLPCECVMYWWKSNPMGGIAHIASWLWVFHLSFHAHPFTHFLLFSPDLSGNRHHWLLCCVWDHHGKDGRESQVDAGLLQLPEWDRHETRWRDHVVSLSCHISHLSIDHSVTLFLSYFSLFWSSFDTNWAL